MTVLAVRDLNVWFDLPGGRAVHAVRGASFTVNEGERLGIVGESGCGKSTTALAILGLLPSSASVAGEVLLDGKNILGASEATMRRSRWREVAMVFQGSMNALNPVKTVGAQIVEPMMVHGTAQGHAARARAGELLEMVGIPAGTTARYPHELSGGMRQRVCLAMALACEPRVLLADEPTTALDVIVQAQVLQLLIDLSTQRQLALVLITHDLPVVAQVCHRAAVMYAGEMVERASTDALASDPRHPYTRMLWNTVPDLYGDHEVVSIPGSPPRLDTGSAGCPFFPRCDSGFDRCTRDNPVLLPVGDRHDASCHLNTDEGS